MMTSWRNVNKYGDNYIYFLKSKLNQKIVKRCMNKCLKTIFVVNKILFTLLEQGLIVLRSQYILPIERTRNTSRWHTHNGSRKLAQPRRCSMPKQTSQLIDGAVVEKRPTWGRPGS